MSTAILAVQDGTWLIASTWVAILLPSILSFSALFPGFLSQKARKSVCILYVVNAPYFTDSHGDTENTVTAG